jgi:hypothetical protein
MSDRCPKKLVGERPLLSVSRTHIDMRRGAELREAVDPSS